MRCCRCSGGVEICSNSGFTTADLQELEPAFVVSGIIIELFLSADDTAIGVVRHERMRMRTSIDSLVYSRVPRWKERDQVVHISHRIGGAGC